MKRTPLLSAGSVAAMLLGGALTACAQTYGTTVVAPTQTQVFQFNTTTTTASPTYNRAAIAVGLNNFTTTTPASSGIGASVHYATSAAFTPTTPGNGTYTVNTSATGFDTANYIQYIYQPALVPTTAATALQGLKYGYFADTASNTGSYNVTLTGATPYQFVNAGYYSDNATYPQIPGNGFYSEGTATTTVLYDNPGSQTSIPDPTETIVGAGTNGEYATYTPTPVSQTLTVTDTTTIGTFNGITIIGLQHPALGDLTATLTHNGVTVDLFDHTGANAANYNQGSQAKFDGGNYTFAPTGASLAGIADFTTAPDGTYMATGNAATGFDKANAANTLSAFAGMSVAGAWTLTMTDEQVDDTGSFLGFSFNVSPAPEPSEYAALGVGLLGLGVLALRARRRQAA